MLITNVWFVDRRALPRSLNLNNVFNPESGLNSYIRWQRQCSPFSDGCYARYCNLRPLCYIANAWINQGFILAGQIVYSLASKLRVVSQPALTVSSSTISNTEVFNIICIMFITWAMRSRTVISPYTGANGGPRSWHEWCLTTTTTSINYILDLCERYHFGQSWWWRPVRDCRTAAWEQDGPVGLGSSSLLCLLNLFTTWVASSPPPIHALCTMLRSKCNCTFTTALCDHAAQRGVEFRMLRACCGHLTMHRCCNHIESHFDYLKSCRDGPIMYDLAGSWLGKLHDIGVSDWNWDHLQVHTLRMRSLGMAEFSDEQMSETLGPPGVFPLMPVRLRPVSPLPFSVKSTFHVICW